MWRGQVKCGGRGDIRCIRPNWAGQVVSGGSKNYMLVCAPQVQIGSINYTRELCTPWNGVFYCSAQTWRLILVVPDWNVLPQSYGKIDPEVDPEPKKGYGGWSGAQKKLRIWSKPKNAWSGRKKDLLRMTEVGHEKITKRPKSLQIVQFAKITCFWEIDFCRQISCILQP